MKLYVMEIYSVQRMALMLLLPMVLSGCNKVEEDQAGVVAYDKINPALLAECLSNSGWVMFGSETCSACRAQRKLFGDAFGTIASIECNPHSNNAQTDLCLKYKVKKTPTWIKIEGPLDKQQEIKRIESFQLLTDLAQQTDCN